MIYFFEKDGQFRQLEIYPERPYTLACIDATGASRTERFWSQPIWRNDGMRSSASCVKLAGPEEIQQPWGERQTWITAPPL